MDATNAEALRDLLLASANRRDVDGSPIDELGFSVGLWNADNEAPTGLSVTCGAWTTTPGVMNAFVLDFPPRVLGQPMQLVELDTAICLMRSVAEVWEPDWATLTSYELADELDAPPREPSVGWLTFLSDRRPVPDGAPIARRLTVRNGTILASAEDVEAVDTSGVKDLADVLRGAGSLAPTP